MARLNKEDLAQMNRSYFQSLSKERLVEVADNLHLLASASSSCRAVVENQLRFR